MRDDSLSDARLQRWSQRVSVRRRLGLRDRQVRQRGAMLGHLHRHRCPRHYGLPDSHDCTDGLRLLQRELQRRHLPDWDLYCRVYIMLVHERHRVLGGNVRQLGGLYDKRMHWFWCRRRVPLQPVSDGAKASSR